MDFLTHYRRGGKIGLFRVAEVGKTILIRELINNIAKAHGGVSVYISSHSIPSVIKTLHCITIVWLHSIILLNEFN